MAKVIVLQGKNKGQIYDLDQSEIFIGRESANQIVLNDSSVSRRHCVIEKREENYFITDLQSLNGTFVNEEAAENFRLKSGDYIRIGDFSFRFTLDKDIISASSNSIFFDERKLDLSKTIHLKIEEVLGAMTRDLFGLLKISEKINSVRGLEKLQQELLNEIFEVVPAREGAILLLDSGGDISETFAVNLDEENSEIKISRTIIETVLQKREAILANDINDEENLKFSESLLVSQSFSVLCVPLIIFGKSIGLIYLSQNRPTTKFDESHLRFMSAMSSIAAVAIENIRNIELLEMENARLREESFPEKNMLGESPAMKKIFSLISRVSPTDSTVLITGESGTGKELAARAVHLNSLRKEQPFVAINCAALTETLLESELFGYERGAFTGAMTQKKGKIEIADGGTLFLDEIGEMAVSLQAKILRVLQEREFERVGGIKPLKSDIRLIAATNRDLEQEAKNGNFRQDLFYRLNVISFRMPSLRERKEDILILAEKFAEKFALKLNRKIRGISAKAKKHLTHYDFPGNVRELENAIERAVVLGVDEWILPEDLPESFWDTKTADVSEKKEFDYHETIQAKKKELILNAFIKSKGSYVETAKLLDVHPNYLHRLVKNLNIKKQLDEISTA